MYSVSSLPHLMMIPDFVDDVVFPLPANFIRHDKMLFSVIDSNHADFFMDWFIHTARFMDALY